MRERERLLLECVDCHAQIKGETHRAVEAMLRHTREWHGRDLVFGRDFYKQTRRTANDFLVNASLLRPELIICA